jgi:hypothetical protein
MNAQPLLSIYWFPSKLDGGRSAGTADVWASAGAPICVNVITTAATKALTTI